MQAIKDRFDPENILNPGRFVFEIGPSPWEREPRQCCIAAAAGGKMIDEKSTTSH